MEQARSRLIADRRLDVLSRRVRAWQEPDAIRAYCDSVEAEHGADAVATDPEAAEWLAFARQHAEEMQRLPRMPADAEVSAEALKPLSLVPLLDLLAQRHASDRGSGAIVDAGWPRRVTTD